MRKEYVTHQVRKLRKARGAACFMGGQLSQAAKIDKDRLLKIEAEEVRPTKTELSRIRAAIAQKTGVRSF